MAIHFREMVCVSEPIRIYTVQQPVPLLPLRTQGDQAELYPMLVSLVCCYHTMIQTDLETSGYLLTLLVVVLVEANQGDRDTANLQGNREKKFIHRPDLSLSLNRITPHAGLCLFKPISMHVDLKVH